MDIVLITGSDATSQFKSIKTAIDSIGKRGKALDVDIHVCAVSCLNHAEQHGDVTLCTRLVNAMPKSSRRKALIHWFTMYGPLSFEQKANAFHVAKGRNIKPYDVEGASVTPFYDLTPERNPEPYTVEKLIAFVQRKVKELKENDKVTEGDLGKLETAVREAFTA